MQLGFPHPDYLIEKLTASQLSEWYAFNSLEPIGEHRADYRVSYLASLITNLAIRINGKKGDKLSSVKDFLFEWDSESSTKGTGTQSIEEMKSVFNQIAAAGRISGKDKKRLEERRTHKPKSLQK